MLCDPRYNLRRLSLHLVLGAYCICHIARSCTYIAIYPAHIPTAPPVCSLQSLAQTSYISFIYHIFLFSVAKVIQISISANWKF